MRLKERSEAVTKHTPLPCPEPMGLRLSPAAGPRRRACSSAPPREGPSVHPTSGKKTGVEKKKERGVKRETHKNQKKGRHTKKQKRGRHKNVD